MKAEIIAWDKTSKQGLYSAIQTFAKGRTEKGAADKVQALSDAARRFGYEPSAVSGWQLNEGKLMKDAVLEVIEVLREQEGSWPDKTLPINEQMESVGKSGLALAISKFEWEGRRGKDAFMMRWFPGWGTTAPRKCAPPNTYVSEFVYGGRGRCKHCSAVRHRQAPRFPCLGWSFAVCTDSQGPALTQMHTLHQPTCPTCPSTQRTDADLLKGLNDLQEKYAADMNSTNQPERAGYLVTNEWVRLRLPFGEGASYLLKKAAEAFGVAEGTANVMGLQCMHGTAMDEATAVDRMKKIARLYGIRRPDVTGELGFTVST